MVTVYKISEKKIGNRVSKSNGIYWDSFVKEQRVYGSYHNELWLRCILNYSWERIKKSESFLTFIWIIK